MSPRRHSIVLVGLLVLGSVLAIPAIAQSQDEVDPTILVHDEEVDEYGSNTIARYDVELTPGGSVRVSLSPADERDIEFTLVAIVTDADEDGRVQFGIEPIRFARAPVDRYLVAEPGTTVANRSLPAGDWPYRGPVVGTYTVDVGSPDDPPTDNATLDVESVGLTPNFETRTIRFTPGEVVTLNASLDDYRGGALRFEFGGDGATWAAGATVNDTDGDGHVGLQVDTSQVGNESPGAYFRATRGDELRNVSQSSALEGGWTRVEGYQVVLREAGAYRGDPAVSDVGILFVDTLTPTATATPTPGAVSTEQNATTPVPTTAETPATRSPTISTTGAETTTDGATPGFGLTITLGVLLVLTGIASGRLNQ